jgi:hypothetical protein
MEIPNAIKSIPNAIATNVQSGVNSIKNTVNSFSTPAPSSFLSAGQDFLNANSIIAKFVFILLVVIVFVILFNLGIMLITYLLKSSQSPYLVKGLINGNNYIHITQDPSIKESIPIRRSNNKPTGIEHSWSVWLYITDPGSSNTSTTYSHIFNMGNGEVDSTTGIANINNSPGLYIKKTSNAGPNTCTLHAVMDVIPGISQNTQNQTVDISTIPIKKWVHVLLRLENNTMDVYINGVITSRVILTNVPKLNYNDIYVCNNGGFNGNVSDLRYFDHALTVFEINRIVTAGPNLTAAINSTGTQYHYLSTNWYNSNYNIPQVY